MAEVDPGFAARSKRLAAEWQSILTGSMRAVLADGGDPREILDAMLTVAIANKCSLEGASVIAAHLKEIAGVYECASPSSLGRTQ